IPEVCTDIFSPVGGCDDKTYPNAGSAAAASVSVVSEGECASNGGGSGSGGADHGCAYDGKPYAMGEGFPSSDGCNTCSCKGDDKVICTLKACMQPPEKTCGGLQGA